MAELPDLTDRNGRNRITFWASFLVCLALCAVLLHPLFYFKQLSSPLLVVLIYLVWLFFRILCPRLPDLHGVVRGALLGLEVFLLIEFTISTVVLFLSDRSAFAGSLFFSAGLFFLLDRFRKIFPALRERWPLSMPAFGMSALLFFGMFSTAVLCHRASEDLKPEGGKNLGKSLFVPEVVLASFLRNCLPIGVGDSARACPCVSEIHVAVTS